MLVLSRKVGERIWIGDNISVTVVRITGGGVRLGIEAPSVMPVVREELKTKINESEANSVELSVSPQTIKFRQS
jgi:carbon storage regulator